MHDPLDLQDLGRIPDPFSRVAAEPVPPPPQALRAAASASRAVLHRRRVVAAVAALLYEIGWVAVVERRSDLGSLPAWSIALGLSVPLVAAGVALAAATRKGPRGLGAPVLSLAIFSTLSPVLFALATLATSPPDADNGRFWNLAARCMGVTALLTAGPLVLGAFAFRHAFVTASATRTAALGLACGALAAATMSLACPDSGAFHVLVGHGAMIVAGAVAGALLGRHITRA